MENREEVKNDAENDEKENDSEPQAEANQHEVEKQQEAMLRAKYSGMKMQGGSALLQKRISKGHKFFDSGDYQMQKAKVPGVPVETEPKPPVPVEHMVLPTPENVPQRKASIITNTKIFQGAS